jgi:hypothetical protein
MPLNRQLCSKCKKTSQVEAQFCQHCGHEFNDKSSNSKPGLNHWHIIYTVIIVFMAEMIFSFIAIQGWIISYPETMDNLSTLGKVADAGAFTGIFSGSLFAAYRFAEKSKKEVLAGTVAAVLISKITVISVIDTPGLQFIIGTLLVLITAFAGIMTGVLILKKRGRL